MKANKFLVALIPVVLLFLFACSGGGKKYTFSDDAVSGKAGGTDVVFSYGRTMYKELFGKPVIKYNLYTDDVDVCNNFPGSEYQVMFNLPQDTGLYELDMKTSVTINWGSNNIICFDGAIHIVNINLSDNTITGKIDAKSGEENYINGTFTVPVCK
ncbi:hypothetical protein ACFLRQ_02415 [Bacteroidota bacterium]